MGVCLIECSINCLDSEFREFSSTLLIKVAVLRCGGLPQLDEYTRSNCPSMATLLYDTFTYPSYILIILLKIKCFLQYIYMHIVYSNVAMEGLFTLVKEGGLLSFG